MSLTENKWKVKESAFGKQSPNRTGKLIVEDKSLCRWLTNKKQRSPAAGLRRDEIVMFIIRFHLGAFGAERLFVPEDGSLAEAVRGAAPL